MANALSLLAGVALFTAALPPAMAYEPVDCSGYRESATLEVCRQLRQTVADHYSSQCRTAQFIAQQAAAAGVANPYRYVAASCGY